MGSRAPFRFEGCFLLGGQASVVRPWLDLEVLSRVKGLVYKESRALICGAKVIEMGFIAQAFSGKKVE